MWNPFIGNSAKAVKVLLEQKQCKERTVCGVTGRCVLEALRCNADDDCGDGSDELGCKKVYKACNQPTEEYYGIENLAKGCVCLKHSCTDILTYSSKGFLVISCLFAYVFTLSAYSSFVCSTDHLKLFLKKF